MSRSSVRSDDPQSKALKRALTENSGYGWTRLSTTGAFPPTQNSGYGWTPSSTIWPRSCPHWEQHGSGYTIEHYLRVVPTKNSGEKW